VTSASVLVMAALVGGAGAVARFSVDGIVSRLAPTSLPTGTLTVNATATFLLGVLMGAGVGGSTMLVLGSAGIGSYSTFSTWVFEARRLAEDHRRGAALASVAIGVAVGLISATVGWWLGGLA
jgi:CrcB protein